METTMSRRGLYVEDAEEEEEDYGSFTWKDSNSCNGPFTMKSYRKRDLNTKACDQGM